MIITFTIIKQLIKFVINSFSQKNIFDAKPAILALSFHAIILLAFFVNFQPQFTQQKIIKVSFFNEEISFLSRRVSGFSLLEKKSFLGVVFDDGERVDISDMTSLFILLIDELSSYLLFRFHMTLFIIL